MDIPHYESRRMDTSDYTISESGFNEDITSNDDYSKVSNNCLCSLTDPYVIVMNDHYL